VIAPIIAAIDQLNRRSQGAMTCSVVAQITGPHINTVPRAIDEDKNPGCRCLRNALCGAEKARRSNQQNHSNDNAKSPACVHARPAVHSEINRAVHRSFLRVFVASLKYCHNSD
jgi:hypothetical protein